MAWAEKEQVLVYYFEAFDENWKGSDDPLEPEKHWGLYRADRTPKLALQALGRRVREPTGPPCWRRFNMPLINL